MLGRVHRLAVSRLAAVALALALSGAVRVAAALEPHEGGGHRCSCPIRDGAHECACPRCRSTAAAPAPSAEELAKQPACHRALHAEGQATRRAPPPSPRPDQDCAAPLCGLPDGRLAAAPTTDTFLLPDPPRLSVAVWIEPLARLEPVGSSTAPAPEPPPPRA